MKENEYIHKGYDNGNYNEPNGDGQGVPTLRTIIIITGVAFVVMLAWLFIGGMFMKSERTQEATDFMESFDAMYELSAAYDTEGALQQAEETLRLAREAGAPPFIEAYIQIEKAGNLFSTNDPELQREAVRILRSIVNDERLTRGERTEAVNYMLGLYYTARSEHVFEEIFLGEPFADLRGDTESSSIRNLAEYSLSLYPTSFAFLRAANWYSNELLESTTLSGEQREEYRAEIQADLSQARALFEKETENLGPENQVSAPLFYHWLGFHLGVLAIDDAGNSYPFEEAFVSAITQGAEDDPGATYTHFYYAAFLHEVYGDERIEDQRAQLQSLVDMVNAQPSIFEPGFLAFMERERTRPTETRDHNYKWFIELAEVSPTFREFLTEHGWDLS